MCYIFTLVYLDDIYMSIDIQVCGLPSTNSDINNIKNIYLIKNTIGVLAIARLLSLPCSIYNVLTHFLQYTSYCSYVI